MTLPVVLIEWLDVGVKIGWIKDHHDANLVPIDSVGFLIYEDDRIIKIAQDNSSSGAFGEIETIPKSIITKRTKLIKKKAKK